MKPLKNHQEVLIKLYHSSDENESQSKKVIRILLMVTLFVMNLSFTISSAVFMWKSVNLEEKLYPLFQICGGLVIYSSIVMIILRRKVAAIFENLSEFHNECKEFSLYFIISRARRRIKKTIDQPRFQFICEKKWSNCSNDYSV